MSALMMPSHAQDPSLHDKHEAKTFHRYGAKVHVCQGGGYACILFGTLASPQELRNRASAKQCATQYSLFHSFMLVMTNSYYVQPTNATTIATTTRAHSPKDRP